MKGEGDSPQDDIETEPFGNGNPLYNPVLRILDDENDNVDDGSQP